MALLYSAHLNDNWLNSVIHKVHKTFSEFGRGGGGAIVKMSKHLCSLQKKIFSKIKPLTKTELLTPWKKEAMKDKRLISYIYSF